MRGPQPRSLYWLYVWFCSSDFLRRSGAGNPDAVTCKLFDLADRFFQNFKRRNVPEMGQIVAVFDQPLSRVSVAVERWKKPTINMQAS